MYSYEEERREELERMKKLTPSRTLREYEDWDGEKRKVADSSFEDALETPVVINGLTGGKIYGNKK